MADDMIDLMAAVAAKQPRLKIVKVEVEPPKPRMTKLVFVDKEAAHQQVGAIGYVIEGNDVPSVDLIVARLSDQLEKNDAAVKEALAKKLAGQGSKG